MTTVNVVSEPSLEDLPLGERLQRSGFEMITTICELPEIGSQRRRSILEILYEADRESKGKAYRIVHNKDSIDLWVRKPQREEMIIA